ncbi:tetratricopeptide repeat protein [Bradyrhizobium canariense]|nr:tetratricopeptide repeat protein [Bradyrhizobium canariense]
MGVLRKSQQAVRKSDDISAPGNLLAAGIAPERPRDRVVKAMSKHPFLSPTLSSAPGRQNSSEDALERAAFALRMQRPDEAERLAARVLKANRSNAAAATILGQALMAQNRADEAIAPLERAARRSGDPATETLLAATLSAAGRREEALEQLRQTTARRPPFPPAFREHADQLAKAGRVDEAIVVLENGLELTPDVTDLQVSISLLYLGRNRRTKARTVLLKALTAAPGRHDVLAALAHVTLLDGEYASAADIYRRVLALRPDDTTAQANFGVCLLEMGERDAGEAVLRSTTRGKPEMMGRAIHSLAASSHGRFFLRPSAIAKFLRS